MKKYTLRQSIQNLRVEYVFLLIGAVIGLFYVFITPPFWGLDEVAHFNRAYKISEGQIISKKNTEGKVDKIMSKNLVLLEYTAWGDLVDNKKTSIFARQDVNDKEVYKLLVEKKFSHDTMEAPIIANYSAMAYPGASLGILISDIFGFSIGKTITMARIGSLAFYLGIVFLALQILRKRKVRYIVLSVALLPSSLFLASTVSADGALIGFCLLFFASFFEIILSRNERKHDRIATIALIISAIAIPLIKLPYIFLSLTLILLPNNLFGRKKITVLLKIILSFIIIFTTFLWAIITKVAEDTVSQRPDGLPVVASQQIQFIIHHPLGFVGATIRTFIYNSDWLIQSLTAVQGWNEAYAPMIFSITSIMLLALSAVYAKEESLKLIKSNLLVLVFCIISIALIFASLYISFTPVASNRVDGIQGRYFIPFLFPTLLLIGYPLSIIKAEKNAKLAIIIGSVIVLIANLANYCLQTY